MKHKDNLYSNQLADEICLEIAEGASLKTVCEQRGLKYQTVLGWIVDDRKHLDEDKEGFADKYARARRAQAHGYVDRIFQLCEEAKNSIVGNDKSDSARVNAYRLSIDSIKWYASKVLPKLYGDKLDIDLTSGGKEITWKITNGNNLPETETPS